MAVRVRYFAGAAAAAGTPEEHVELAEPTSVAELLARLGAARPALAPVLAVSSVLVDEVAVGDRATAVPAGAQVDVLPPFAGG